MTNPQPTILDMDYKLSLITNENLCKLQQNRTEEDTLAKQQEFVSWLQQRNIYNPNEDAVTMQKLHQLWELSQLELDAYLKDILERLNTIV
jgi:ribosome assembly protein YihI (activator of Der GTPase)